ncbi:MAG: twin-arginine translocation signal domain-containing protein [Deltaproteobacteria bacterium]|nr:twin-arginine translocation signal domain-containing protein [Deltaproteobacteria bacterium]
MNRRNFLGGLGVGVAALGTAAASAGAESFARPPADPLDPPDPPGDKPPPVRDRKVWREALAAARTRHIARLSIYRDVGRFPLNHRVLGSIPTFIDHRGAPCAVGHLMQQSGHAALAADIARTNNNVYVEELGDGPALDWILFSGLTREECALIQPSYRWREPRRPVPQPELPHPEQDTLRQHFTLVERRLRGDTEVALRLAMARLEPRIERGVQLSRVVG